MNERSRIPILLAAVVVIVLAFVFLRPKDDDTVDSARPTKPATTNPTARPGKTAPKKPTGPAVKRLRVEIVDAKPVRGVETLPVSKNETVSLTIDSDVADEVHLHGYDISRKVAPGRPANLTFKAKIEGIFETELEQRGIEIARVQVNP